MDGKAKEPKLRPGSRAWGKAAAELAMAYAPTVGACYACKQPCLAGFCCQSCGSGQGSYDNESGERLRG